MTSQQTKKNFKCIPIKCDKNKQTQNSKHISIQNQCRPFSNPKSEQHNDSLDEPKKKLTTKKNIK